MFHLSEQVKERKGKEVEGRKKEEGSGVLYPDSEALQARFTAHEGVAVSSTPGRVLL
jgi:hypothetical protein